MKLHFLGTSGYHPNSRRHTACLMIPEIGVILDAGTGIFRARERIQTDSLQVFLTHAHLDHSIGLTFFFDIHCEKLDRKTRVYATADKIDAIQHHLFATLLFPALPELEFHSLESQTTVDLPAGVQLRHFPVEHPGGAVGFRLDGPHGSMAYVTDTTARTAAAYVEPIRDVDLLVHECYFPDGFEAQARLTGHSCLTDVLNVAHRARARRLALVHLNPLESSSALGELTSGQTSGLEIIIPDDEDILEF